MSNRVYFLALSLLLASLLTTGTISQSIADPLPKAATPTFTPAGGTYNSPQNITIKCSTQGATIRYTLDGSTPTFTSQTYSNPIFLNATTTVKAMASASRYKDSDVASATYTINLPKVATPTFSPPSGIYSSAQSVAIQCATSGVRIYYTTNGGDPSTSSALYSSPISVSTSITLKAKAFKTDWLDSNINSAAYIIELPQVATPTFSPPGGNYSAFQNVTLSCATSGAIIRYTIDGSDPTLVSTVYDAPISVTSTTTIKAEAFMAGMTDSDKATAVFAITIPRVTIPTFAPGEGTYFSAQTVALASSTAGSSIRFTVDGSDPASSSTVYSIPITVATNMTIKAKAFVSGWADSDIAVAAYVIVISPPPQVAPPTFSPGAGVYALSTTVTFSCSTSDANLRYTTDGSEPTASSTLYSGPVLVNSNITLKAKAFKPGMTDSDTATAIYTITMPKVAIPAFAPVAGTYSSAQTVSLLCNSAGASIRFTIDGSNPSSSSAAYSGPIVVASNLTIKARAFVGGWIDSDIATAAFVIVIQPPLKVATPIFNPLGGSYSVSQNVTLSCNTADATIRYTLDGSDPSSSSATYSTPIQAGSTMMLKARAFKSGMADSDVVTATYTITSTQDPTNITTRVATPSFSLPAGTYSSSQNVELSCATSGATIRYSIDGSEPSSSSTIYFVPIVIRATTTVKAKGFMAGMNDSDTATATYTFVAGGKIATPTFDPWGGDYSSAQTVTIQCAADEATIRYTTNGDQPSLSSPVYSGPIFVNVSTTIKARAFLDGMTDSDTASTTYTINLDRTSSTSQFLGGWLVYPLVSVVAVVALVGGALYWKFVGFVGKQKEIELKSPSDADGRLQLPPLPVSREQKRIESLPQVAIVQQPVPKSESIKSKLVEPLPPSDSIQQPAPVVETSKPVAIEILKCPICAKDCSKKEHDDGLCWRCELLEFEKRWSR